MLALRRSSRLPGPSSSVRACRLCRVATTARTATGMSWRIRPQASTIRRVANRMIHFHGIRDSDSDRPISAGSVSPLLPESGSSETRSSPVPLGTCGFPGAMRPPPLLLGMVRGASKWRNRVRHGLLDEFVDLHRRVVKTVPVAIHPEPDPTLSQLRALERAAELTPGSADTLERQRIWQSVYRLEEYTQRVGGTRLELVQR